MRLHNLNKPVSQLSLNRLSSITNGLQTLVIGITRPPMMIGTPSRETKMSGPKLQTIMMVSSTKIGFKNQIGWFGCMLMFSFWQVDTKLSVGTVVTESSAEAGARTVDLSMVMVDEAGEAVTGATRMIGRAATSETITMKAATPTIRMATTKMVKEVVTEEEEAWTDPDLTVGAWTEEVCSAVTYVSLQTVSHVAAHSIPIILLQAQGVVPGVTHGVVVDTEEVKLVVKVYQLAVLGLSSSAS